MSLSKEEYSSLVRVLITPEGEHMHVPGEPGLLSMGTTFWLHTQGLEDVGFPELEIRGVPAMGLLMAAGEINHWGHYMAETGKTIKVGEKMATGDMFDPPWMAASTTDPGFWEDTPVLLLRPIGVHFHCGCD